MWYAGIIRSCLFHHLAQTNNLVFVDNAELLAGTIVQHRECVVYFTQSIFLKNQKLPLHVLRIISGNSCFYFPYKKQEFPHLLQ